MIETTQDSSEEKPKEVASSKKIENEEIEHNQDKEALRKGWIVLFAMLFAGIIAIMNQFKVPTFMSEFIPIFGSAGNAGWLMSVIAVAGIVTAFPSAFLLNRFGPKKIGLIGLGFMVIGCGVGAIAGTITDGGAVDPDWLAPVLIVSRLIEGMGVATMGVVATTVISMYFPREKAGMPMALWNLWYVVGSTLAYNIGKPIAIALTGDPHAWQAWWWFCDVAALLGFIVFAIFVSVPHRGRGVAAEKEKATQEPQHRPASILLEGFRVKRMWIFGLGFMFLLGTSLCILTWVPTYVQTQLMGDLVAQNLAAGMSQDAAQGAAAAQAGIESGVLSSLGFAASIPMTIIMGFVLGRFTSLKARHRICMFAATMTFLYMFAFLIPYEYLAFYLILLGLEAGITSGILWAMVPVTMPKRVTMPVGMAIVIFFQGISNLLCTPVVGYVIGPDMVWANVAPLCFVTCAIGWVLWFAYTRMKPPVFDEDEEADRLPDITQVDDIDDSKPLPA